MNAIWEWLKRAWAYLKKIFVAIFNFFTNLTEWFKNWYKTAIQKHPNAKPIALRIKKELSSGNYNSLDIGLSSDEAIVNTFYDEITEEILEEYTEVIESNELDSETQKAFGNKDMIILS